MDNGFKVLHDQLLANKPEGAIHEEETCPLCGVESLNANEGTTSHDQPKGGSDVNTYTQEELETAIAAVKEARLANTQVAAAGVSANVADAITKIDVLAGEVADQAVKANTVTQDATKDEGDAQKAELIAKIAELEAQLGKTAAADLQAKLDAAVLEAATEKKAREDLEASIEAAKAAEEEAKVLAARKEERLTKVKEVASFPDEYLAENADRFAAMSDDDFDKAVKDWTTITAKAGEQIPGTTALVASRDDNQSTTSALAEIMELRRSGTDVKSLH